MICKNLKQHILITTKPLYNLLETEIQLTIQVLFLKLSLYKNLDPGINIAIFETVFLSADCLSSYVYYITMLFDVCSRSISISILSQLRDTSENNVLT